MEPNYKLSFTKLKKVLFDESNFDDEMTFSLKIEYLLQEKHEEDRLTVIKVLGDLTGKNTNNDIGAAISMESYFETDEDIEENELDNLSEHLNKPVLNEISLLFAHLTGKALKMPIILPLEINENSTDEN